MIVRRIGAQGAIGGDWSEAPWREIPSEVLCNYMGAKPDHFPRTEVKIAYDDRAIHVMFRVEDRYVRAIAREHQESVCGDSCVEFFFTPGPDVSRGYFNFEMNCGGTILFHFHPGLENRAIEIPKDDCGKIAKVHSLPPIVEPEIQKPTTWMVQYSIPMALLKRYCQVSTPQPGALWRANFYKCADHTSHPHWLAWSPVDYPKPNFHLPQSFGFLEFE